MFFRVILAVLFSLYILLLPLKVFSADLLQIRSPTLFQIGDNNRSYTVELPCIDVDIDSQEEAMDWLTNYLPRKVKVNLRPKGSVNGILISRVIPLNTGKDLNQELIEQGFARDVC